MKGKNKQLLVQGVPVHLAAKEERDYISLTDMTAKFEEGRALIGAWLRNKDTIEFLGTWERIHNPGFNDFEFDVVKNSAGLNRFTLSARQWIKRTAGIGLIAKEGRYGGTFAHRDIAFEFGGWLSPEFKLYLIKEFQRLKQAESDQGLEWNMRRTLTKMQYRVHTDAVKAKLIPLELNSQQVARVYAEEADLLNMALFGMTALQWKAAHPDTHGNMRDCAELEQLIVLSSLESQNALLIQQGVGPCQRLQTLNQQARLQLQSLLSNPTLAVLPRQ